MAVAAVLVGLPGTLCSPVMVGPLAWALAGEVDVAPFSCPAEPGPWDIPSVPQNLGRNEL
jgi:hypothetical protein